MGAVGREQMPDNGNACHVSGFLVYGTGAWRAMQGRACWRDCGDSSLRNPVDAVTPGANWSTVC